MCCYNVMISDCVFCFVLVSVLNSVSNSFRDLATALGSADSSPSRGEHVAVAVCVKAVQLMADRKLRDRHKLQRYVLSDLLSSHLQQFSPLPETVPQLSAKYYLCGNSLHSNHYGDNRQWFSSLKLFMFIWVSRKWIYYTDYKSDAYTLWNTFDENLYLMVMKGKRDFIVQKRVCEQLDAGGGPRLLTDC